MTKPLAKKISVQDFLDMAEILDCFCEIYDHLGEGKFVPLKGMSGPYFNNVKMIPFSAFTDWDNRIIMMKNKQGTIIGFMGYAGWAIDGGGYEVADSWSFMKH